MALMTGGRIEATGAPADVLASEACSSAFGVLIRSHSAPGAPHPLYTFEEAPR
jgi:ABC-type hemin transport system ATPase subunit